MAETQRKQEFGREMAPLRETHQLNEESNASDWAHPKEEHRVVGDLELRRQVLEAVAHAMKPPSTLSGSRQPGPFRSKSEHRQILRCLFRTYRLALEDRPESIRVLYNYSS